MLAKPQRKFLVVLLSSLLVVCGRATYRNLSRYSGLSERTYRRQMNRGIGLEWLSIEVPTDNDGFVTLECPFCGGRFKLSTEDFEREDVIYLFCPYYGLQEEGNSFLASEVMAQVEIVALNYVKSTLNKHLANMKQRTKGNRLVTYKTSGDFELEPENSLFESEEMDCAN